MKRKVLKRIIAVACAVTMVTSGMTSSVGAVEWVTDGVVTKNIDEGKRKVNELNECIVEFKHIIHSFIEHCDKDVSGSIRFQRLLPVHNFLKTKKELFEKLDKIKIKSVNGIDDLICELNRHKELAKRILESYVKDVSIGNFIDICNTYDENLLKTFNSWYYSGVVLHSKDNITNTEMRKLIEERDKKLVVNKAAMKKLKTEIKENERGLDNRKLQDHNRLLQLHDVKEDIKKVKNKLYSYFEANNKLTEYEEIITKRASECGLLYDVKTIREVYDRFNTRYAEFSRLDSDFCKWLDSEKIVNRKEDPTRFERINISHLGWQLKYHHFDVEKAEEFFKLLREIRKKMFDFQHNYRESKANDARKLAGRSETKG